MDPEATMKLLETCLKTQNRELSNLGMVLNESRTEVDNFSRN